jgi:hypothetical protein
LALNRLGGGLLTSEAQYDGGRQHNNKRCPFKNSGDHNLLLSFETIVWDALRGE